MRRIGICFLFFLSACSSSSLKEPAKEIPSPVPRHGKKEVIDIRGLKMRLGLDRTSEELGFQEKSFNPCTVGDNLVQNTGCADRFLVVVHFRVQCRNSEGTISTTLEESDLFPIKGEFLQWRLKDLEGQSRIDDHGFGQIEAVSAISQKRQWLRLSNGEDFLNVRAGEITRIVTPKNWCDFKKYSL